MNITIRNETPCDYKTVEQITREAFWNLYVMGCDEHYLVHIMRDHPDFISNLAFVGEVDKKIVGNIMFVRSNIADQSGNRIETVNFGPLTVLPEYQRKGIGTALIEHAKRVALENGHNIIIIEGHPKNYLKAGFKSSSDFNISDPDGKFPYGLMALELQPGAIPKGAWRYISSDLYQINPEDAHAFDDKNFPPKKREYRYTQYEFELSCRAFVE